MKIFHRKNFTRNCFGLALAALVGSAGATPISPGFDLWSTSTGASVDLGAGPIALQGLSFGPGNTDTIIRRSTGIAAFPDTIPIELVALSLVSTSPVDLSLFGGPALASLTVFVNVAIEDMQGGGNLDGVCDFGETCLLPIGTMPGTSTFNLSPSAGTMTVRHDTANGGHFDSFFDVFAELMIVDLANPNAQPIFIDAPSINLISLNACWSHIPTPSHPSDPRFPSGDFYAGSCDGVPQIVNHTGPHPVTPSVPEPGTLALLGIAGLGFLGARRKRQA